MTDACVPVEGAEDGSLHWVESPTGPRKFATKVLVWDGHQKFFRRYESHKYVQTSGWRYIAPASPDDAAALAEALAEAERLRDYIDAQRTDNERLQVDLYGARKGRDSWRRAAEEFRTETFAAETQVAVLTAENAEMRSDAERFRWLLENQSYANRHSEVLVETHIIEWASLMLPIGSDIRAAIDEDRVALAQSGGGQAER